MVRINSTKFGEIEINGKTHFSDVIIFWDGIIEYREKDKVVHIDEFKKIIDRKVNIIIIGTGQEGTMTVSNKVREMARYMKIKLVEMQSPYAIELFNAYASQHRAVAAIIHTTG